VGDQTQIEFQTDAGKPLSTFIQENGETSLAPRLTVTEGGDRLRVNPDGTIEALQPGKATIQAAIPGLATNKGFLFIKALGRVGATDENGNINWDIVGMVLFFGLSLYVNQILSGAGAKSSTENSQQETVNKITPVIFSAMFLFFPLPAGVLMYMVIANIFQTFQTFILSREPLPDNLQKLVDEQEKAAKIASGGRQTLPFEPGSSKKKAG
jgi:YidC/Oxa1 family membrane protein insertase